MTHFNRNILGVHWRMPIVAALIIALSLVGITTNPAMVDAQSTSIQVTSTNTDAWPSIEATLTVVDASGQPITGLPPESFSATLAGADLHLTGLRTTSDPGTGVAVVLAFDVSGSMEGLPLENARAAGQAVIAQLGPSDQAAIVTFANQPAIVQEFTADKAVLSAAVSSLAAGGNTSLYAGVEESVRLANTASLPRQAVVLLSDGYNFGVETVDPGSSLAAVSASSVLFMSIGLGDAIDQAYLSQLAALTPGQFMIAPAPGDLTALYQTAVDVLRQQYVLTFDAGSLDPNVANGSNLRIQTAAGGTVLAGEATITLPAAVLATPVVPVATPVLEVADAPAAVPIAAPESQSGRSLVPYALIAALGGGAIAVGSTLIWRRRRLAPAMDATMGEEQGLDRFERENLPVSFPTIERAVANSVPGAWLEVAPGSRVPLGDTPTTVGFGSDCMVILTNGTSGRTERASIWRRDGNYMLHNLSRVGGVSISGRAVTWAVLEDGDEIDIGGCKLLFRDVPVGDAAKI